LTPLRKIGAGPFLTVAAFSISALAQAKIDAAQEAFRGQVTAMAASDSIDFAKITAKLKSQGRNATAQSIEKLLAEAKPADAAWQKSVSSALSVGGIAIAKDSNSTTRTGRRSLGRSSPTSCLVPRSSTSLCRSSTSPRTT
jgi:SAM-dependent MidA family methyltransferase